MQQLVEADPLNPSYRTLKAALASSIGEYDQALELYAGVLAEYPQNARVWMSYGHSLKTANRQADCVQTYRKSIELAPQLGEAYWSLANLKTFRFTPADIAAMQAQVADGELTPEDRFHFHFALGKAFEDAGQYAESFQHYEEGNRLRRKGVGYDADWNTEQMRRAKALFTPEFFAARAGQGAGAPDPIFIVGLPRSGSTLLEQILSSHPQVEGTMELADIVNIVRDLGGALTRTKSRYPESIAALDADALRALGERYLEQTRIYRRTDAPFFIDKLPNNFAHTGLIHLILPRAKIIDARRHPLGCCFSGFKQHFARGQHFTYSLDEIGRYYRDYVELMAHYDAVLPGRVHRVIYERMIEDTEARSAPRARLLRPAVRRALPALLRERARRAHRQLRAGAPPHLSRGRRPLAELRALAGPAEKRARLRTGALSARTGVLKPHYPFAYTLVHNEIGETTMTRSRQRKLKRNSQHTHVKIASAPLAAAVVAALSSTPAFAQDPAQSGVLEQVIVTAQKRSENLQEVPLSIQAIGSEQLEELHVKGFEDYVRYLPTVSYQTFGPGFAQVYMRGVASGGDGNHSGSQPSVGIYLDEQPITTIQGALDVQPVRRRARRVAGRSAGHAVRRQLAGGHDPHHHEQARCHRILGRLRPRRQHDDRGRRRLPRAGIRKLPAERPRRGAPGRLEAA